MKFITTILAALAPLAALAGNVYTVIANPGENASTTARVNWHSDIADRPAYCFYTLCSDTAWANAAKASASRELCTVYDSIFSKNAENQDIYESARFIRNTSELRNLKPGTKYMYRIGCTPTDGETRYFKTAPQSSHWTASVISDFHAYLPLPGRVKSAMTMLQTLEDCNEGEFDLALHVGDIIAWGGSYSFWRDLYQQTYFKKYMWAGLNGNHDNMSRGYAKKSNQFFRCANNNPLNGYSGEEGVCYHFTYGDALFIMLNSESMRSDDGLADAQEWVKKVITDNPAKFVIVMEHYQWFFGTDGKTSQYARWADLFDEYGVDLAISANDHVYARTNALYKGCETDGHSGTVYIQTPSSDNERGQKLKKWIHNKDLIRYRWYEGPNTMGALILKCDSDQLTATLYDRHGNALDSVKVLAKKKH